MRNLCILAGLIIFGFTAIPGCKKPNNNSEPTASNTDSTFIKNLAASCAHVFTGQGDSGTYFLPTAFTPNGDGINDVYGLLGMHPSFTSYQLTIYRTNGIKVFQTTSATTSWQGFDTTGAKCTDYKYYVKIKYTTPGLHSADTGTFLFLLPTDTTHHCVTRVVADTASYKFPDQFDPLTGAFSFTTNEAFCN